MNLKMAYHSYNSRCEILFLKKEYVPTTLNQSPSAIKLPQEDGLSDADNTKVIRSKGDLLYVIGMSNENLAKQEVPWSLSACLLVLRRQREEDHCLTGIGVPPKRI